MEGTSLRLEAIGTNGLVFDSMTIQRQPPPPRQYDSVWNTPLIEDAEPNDRRGNIQGQFFRFLGKPIRTFPGEFSNLGQVYVNNDSTNLFIGFDETMIYSSNNIFLFIESPRQSGVSNLAGLGDGLAGLTEVWTVWISSRTFPLATLPLPLPAFWVMNMPITNNATSGVPTWMGRRSGSVPPRSVFL